VKSKLSTRQAYVIAELYVKFGWSCVQIALALEIGRRTVENTLERQGITLERRSKRAFANQPVLPPAAAKQWFERALTEDLVELEPAVRADPQTGSDMYRRRRCQDCGLLTSYAVNCSRCGAVLDWIRPVRNDLDAAELRTLEEQR
jgi:hypothetical protein